MSWGANTAAELGNVDLPSTSANANVGLKNKWSSERLLINGDVLAAALELAISKAQKSIDLCAYIYVDDLWGRKIEALLVEARRRGVEVRVCVDGVGSYGWIKTVGRRLYDQNVKIKIYNQLFWEKWFSNSTVVDSESSLMRLAALMNRRDHRKLCIVDNAWAWVSSMNIRNVSLPSIAGKEAWFELGIELEGKDVEILKASFEITWQSLGLHNRKWYFETLDIINQSTSSSVRLNNTRRLRKFFFHDLIEKLNQAKHRICVATPFFVPSKSFIKALGNAVKRGVCVQILTSAKTDIFFMNWVAAEFQLKVANSGGQLFEFQDQIYHAKYLIVDNYVIIGSSNINRRSLRHDLETDIATDNPHTVAQLVQTFDDSVLKSTSLRAEQIVNRPLWQKALGRLALIFRNSL